MPFPLSSYNTYDIVAIIFSYVDMGVPKYLVEYLLGGTRIPRIFGRGTKIPRIFGRGVPEFLAHKGVLNILGGCIIS